MGLFGSSKIDGEELRQCLKYIEAESKAIALQSREADTFNNAMVEYGNSIMQSPQAGRGITKKPGTDMTKTAKRLSTKATDILNLHNEIKNIPLSASEMHSAWHTTFLANRAYASAMVKAIESDPSVLLASASGTSPQIRLFEQRSIEFRRAYQNS